MEKNVEIRVVISEDYYSAYLYLTAYGSFTSAEIYDELKAKNVVFGVKTSLVEEIARNGKSVAEVVIAEGIRHVFGKDAEIKMMVNVERTGKPKVQEDGRVDFKNVGYGTQVKKGDLLAQKIPATKGMSGMTVTGKSITGKDGKDKVLRYGKNVTVSADGLSLYSDTDGALSLDGDKISVKQLLEIKGDVGPKTGNINFSGDVVVFGNVISGYEISCRGSITIHGVVEGAKLTSGSDMTISRGIQGMDECEIQCGGNLVVNFISSAKRVNVEGDIETGAILHSKIFSNGKIFVKGKKGAIVGGEISAKILLEANIVGSNLGVITSIKLGVDTELHDQLGVLTNEIRNLIEEMDKLQKAQALLRKRVEIGETDMKTVEVLHKVALQIAEEEDRLTEKRSKLKLLNELISSMQDAKIVSRILYPGVRVKIGHSNYYVKEEIAETTIYKSQGEIVLRSN